MFAQGYVKFSRKMLSWQWYTDVTVCKLFFHLMLSANIKNKDWRGLHLKRGDVVSSLPRLSEETGLSIQQIRSALDKLSKTNDITITKHSQFTVYSVNSYDSFQEETWCEDEYYEEECQTSTGQSEASNDADKPFFFYASETSTGQQQGSNRVSTGSQQPSNTHTIYKNYNKDKKYNNYKNSHTQTQKLSEGHPSFDLQKIMEYAITHTPTI